MPFAVRTMLGLALVLANPVFGATPAPVAPASAASPAHVAAVQELLRAMQIEKTLWGVATRSRYATDKQRQAVFAKIEKTPAAEVYRRMAPALTRVISSDTATEMTRFYATPYGKQVIHRKYNSGAQIMLPGMGAGVSPEEKKARQRPAYVKASKELADAEPAIDHAAFVALQAIDKETR